MNLDQLANLAEIIGMVIVIVSLIYLNIQVRQNTTMLRSTAIQGATDQVVEMYDSLIASEAMTDIFMRGLPDPDSLTGVETGRFFAWWMRAMFIMQNWYFQTQQGLVENGTFSSMCKLFTDMSETAGLMQFWGARKHAFDPGFVKFMDDEVFSRQGDKNYRVLSAAKRSDK